MKRYTLTVAAALSVCAAFFIVVTSFAQDRHAEARADLANANAAFDSGLWQQAAADYVKAATALPPGDDRDHARIRAIVALSEAGDHAALDGLSLENFTRGITSLETRVEAQRMAGLYLASRPHTFYTDGVTRDYNFDREAVDKETRLRWSEANTTRPDLQAALSLLGLAHEGSRALLDAVEGQIAKSELQRHVGITLELCDLLEVNDRMNGRTTNATHFFGSDFGHVAEEAVDDEDDIEWEEVGPDEWEGRRPSRIKPGSLSPHYEPFTRRGYYLQPEYANLRTINALIDNAAHRAREIGDRELMAAIQYRLAMLLVNVGLYGNAGLNARLTDWRNPRSVEPDAMRDPRRAFRKLMADFPGSIWEDEARFMLGYIAYYINDFANARLEFARLEKDFPTSRYIGEARRLIQVIEYPQLFTSFSTGASDNALVPPGAPLSVHVHARNIDRVTISLRKLDLRALLASASGGEHAFGELATLEAMPGFAAALGMSVMDQSFELDPATPHFYQSRENIGLYTSTPGTYVLEVTGGPVLERKLVQVGDLALHRRRLAETEQFWVTRQNGDPIHGVVIGGGYHENLRVSVPYREEVLVDPKDPSQGTREVTRFRDERRMVDHALRGRTDTNGLFETALPPESVNNFWATLDVGGALYLVNDRHYPKHVEDPAPWHLQPEPEPTKDLRAFVYTDRPVYRPGDTAHLRVIARLPMGHGNMEGEAATLRVLHNGLEQHSEVVRLNDYGCATGRFDVPLGSPLGTYSIELVHPRIGGRTGFRMNVLEYFKRDVALEVESPSKTYAPGSDLHVPVTFKYLAGGVVAGAPVSYTVSAVAADGKKFNPAAGTMQTSLDGRMVIKLDTGRISRDADGRAVSLTINAEGTGPGGQVVHAQATANISGSGITVSAKWPTANWYSQAPALQLSVTKADGKHANVSGNYTVWTITDQSSLRPSDWRNPSIRKVHTQAFSFSRASNLSVAVPNTSGRYLIELDGEAEGDSFKLSHSLLYVGKGELDNRPFSIMPEFDSYDLTTQPRLLVVQPSPGPVLASMHADGVESGHHYLRSSSGTAIHALPLSEGHAPHIHVSARRVLRGKIMADAHGISVRPASRAIELSVHFDKQRYKPGETVTADVYTRNHRGEAMQAEVALSVWDSALKQFATSALEANLYDHFFSGTRGYKATDRDIGGRTRVSPTRQNTAQVTRWTIYNMPPGSFFYGALSWTSTSNISLAAAHADGALLLEQIRVVEDAKNSLDANYDAPNPPAHNPYYGEYASGGVGGGGGRVGAGGFAHRRARGGGGVGYDRSAPVERRDFRDSAYFNPNIRTDADGHARVSFKLPDNLTEWTFEATAADKAAAIGQTTGAFTAARDLSVRMVGPRGLTEGDEIELTALVQNLFNQAQFAECKLTLNVEGANANLILVHAPEESSGLIDAGRSQEFRYRVRVEGTGTAMLRVDAEGTHDSDSLIWKYEVAPRGMLFSETSTFEFEPGDDTLDLSPWLPAGAILDRSSVTVQFNGSLMGSVVDALPGLVNYPYGCAEQTTNRFVPLMSAIQLLAAYNLDLYEIGKQRMTYNGAVGAENWPSKLSNGREIQKMVDVGFGNLRGYQNADGGWGWFNRDGSNPHLSATVLAGLCSARQVASTVGLSLPASEAAIDAMFAEGATFLLAASQKLDDDPALRARALHAAALAISLLPQDEYTKLREDLRLRVASAEDSLAQDDGGSACLACLLMAQKLSGRDTRGTLKALLALQTVDDQGQLSFPAGFSHGWHDTELEAHALAVQAISTASPGEPVLQRAVESLLARRKGSGWGNTRATGQAIHALAAYLQSNTEEADEARVSITLGSRAIGNFERSKEKLISGRTRWDIRGDQFGEEDELILSRSGSAKVSGSVTVRVFKPVGEDVEADDNGITIMRSYRRRTAVAKEVEVRVEDAQGREIRRYTDTRVEYEYSSLKSGDELKVGDVVTVSITIHADSGDRYLCIEDARPSCLEPIPGRFETEPGWIRTLARTYLTKEERDTTTNFYATEVDSNGRIDFEYDCVVVAGGKFTALPARVFDMYDESRNGHSSSARIEVK